MTIEQMPGVSCVESGPRYSVPWYSNIDVALMGIQSTAQFVEKYHHIIGKSHVFLWLFVIPLKWADLKERSSVNMNGSFIVENEAKYCFLAHALLLLGTEDCYILFGGSELSI